MGEDDARPLPLAVPMRSLIDGLTDLRLRLAGRHGLTLSEADALDHLVSDAARTPGELGRLLRLTSGATSALLDRLERYGYVRRVSGESDRRTVTVRPTPAGVHAAQWSWRQMDRALTATFAKLEQPPSREQFSLLLLAAGEAMREHAESLPGTPQRVR